MGVYKKRMYIYMQVHVLELVLGLSSISGKLQMVQSPTYFGAWSVFSQDCTENTPWIAGVCSHVGKEKHAFYVQVVEQQ